MDEYVVREDVLDERTAAHFHVRPDNLHLLKHSPSGNILIPQPNDDPKNPLNFSARKKWLILLAVSFAGILPDYGSATGAVTTISQGELWGMSANEVNHSQAGNVFMLGAGGVIAVACSNAYGRLPVLFWMILLSVIFAILNAASPNFNTFFASRILNGFFSAPAQATGLLVIHDLFFFHEQIAKTNIWAAFFILSPYLGPIISAAVLSADPTNLNLWRWSFGEFTILSALALLGICLFADETWYNRNVPEEKQPSVGSRLQRLTGIGRPKENTRYTIVESSLRLVTTLAKPPVLMVCISFGLSFAWVVGINTTLPIFLVPIYNFGDKEIALFYFTPIVATILGESVGHFVNAKIQSTFLKRNHGVWKPEARLLINCLAFPFMLSGMILLGYSLERHYHYMLVSLGWGLYVFGIMLSTTGYYQYLLDSYPEASGETSAWINLFRVLGGFIISYFIVDFVEEKGAIVAFGIFAGITAISFAFIPLLYFVGPPLRHRFGHVGYAIPKATEKFTDGQISEKPHFDDLGKPKGEVEQVERV